jgi:hypothetical protein
LFKDCTQVFFVGSKIETLDIDGGRPASSFLHFLFWVILFFFCNLFVDVLLAYSGRDSLSSTTTLGFVVLCFVALSADSGAHSR